jgi:hypothetical protein
LGIYPILELDGLKIEIPSTSMYALAYFLDRYFYHTLTNNNFYSYFWGEMNLAHPIPELDRFRRDEFRPSNSGIG